jgi:hypothetical protein
VSGQWSFALVGQLTATERAAARRELREIVQLLAAEDYAATGTCFPLVEIEDDEEEGQ